MSWLNRLEADLNRLVDPETNESPVKQVTRTVDIYQNVQPVSLPDLFVEWKPSSYFRERVIHPRAVLVRQKHTLRPVRGGETRAGFIGAAGPSINGEGAIGDVSLLDLAPTFLHLMGEPIPQEMTGNVIEAMMHG